MTMSNSVFAPAMSTSYRETLIRLWQQGATVSGGPPMKFETASATDAATPGHLAVLNAVDAEVAL